MTPRCNETKCPFYGLDEGGMIGVIDPNDPNGVCYRVKLDEFNRVCALGGTDNFIMQLQMAKDCMEAQSSVEGDDSSLPE